MLRRHHHNLQLHHHPDHLLLNNATTAYPTRPLIGSFSGGVQYHGRSSPPSASHTIGMDDVVGNGSVCEVDLDTLADITTEAERASEEAFQPTFQRTYLRRLADARREKRKKRESRFSAPSINQGRPYPTPETSSNLSQSPERILATPSIYHIDSNASSTTIQPLEVAKAPRKDFMQLFEPQRSIIADFVFQNADSYWHVELGRLVPFDGAALEVIAVPAIGETRSKAKGAPAKTKATGSTKSKTKAPKIESPSNDTSSSLPPSDADEPDRSLALNVATRSGRMTPCSRDLAEQL
jgi:hypothetical protein